MADFKVEKTTDVVSEGMKIWVKVRPPLPAPLLLLLLLLPALLPVRPWHSQARRRL